MSLTKVSYSMIQGAEVNVLDFGAVGDGVTDDTAAVQAAITSMAVTGGNLVFPDGNYKITSTLTLSSNVNYIAQGNAIITLDVPEIGLQIPNAGTKITINGFTIGGTSARAISSTIGGTCSRITITNNTISGATLAGAGYTSGVFFTNASDCVVENNSFSNNGVGTGTVFSADVAFYAPAAGTQNSRNKILNNRCASVVASFNILAFNIDRTVISENSCSGALNGSGNNSGYGIAVYDTSSYTLPYSTTSFNTISDNIVTNTQGTGIYGASIDNTSIVGNVCTTNGTTQLDATLPVGGIVLNGPFCSQNLIVGNTVASSGKDGICISTNNDTTVSGNTISACAQHGIHLRGSSNELSVSNNVVIASGKRGIFDNVDAKRFISVTGNTVRASTEAGIEINGMTQSVVASNVSCENTLSGITNNGDYNLIAQNVLIGNLAASFVGTAGTGNVRRDNKLSNGESQGVATLVAGAVTVSTAEVRSTDIVLVTRSSLGGTLGQLVVRGIVSGTSFVIDSDSATDTSSVYWQIVH
jgi:parallel beta-helix repeat protein